jgi:menaquinone-dependent protoporphyrinogen oxidase
MAFTKYPWWLRWIMKRISRSQGGPTDTSRDHELTDWIAVEQFAADFAGALSSRSRTGMLPQILEGARQ